MEKTLQRERRRTQAERRTESERGLVQAAIAVVSEEGVSAATFEAIGRRGGYSRGLVGQRFGSKLGLIDAVIAYLHDDKEAFAASHGMDQNPGPILSPRGFHQPCFPESQICGEEVHREGSPLLCAPALRQGPEQHGSNRRQFSESAPLAVTHYQPAVARARAAELASGNERRLGQPWVASHGAHGVGEVQAATLDPD